MLPATVLRSHCGEHTVSHERKHSRSRCCALTLSVTATNVMKGKGHDLRDGGASSSGRAGLGETAGYEGTHDGINQLLLEEQEEQSRKKWRRERR
ncbi:hypothetical protein SRHO_G00221150 [Serrasalmus rhombeus]